MAQEVTQFVVIPPTDRLEQAQSARERIIEALSEKFPGFLFGVADVCPFGDQDEFAVIPVMGMVGDGDAAHMCQEPPRGLLQEMKAVCEGLDLSPTQYLN